MATEPYLAVTPFVMPGKQWRMWYVSGTGWVNGLGGKQEPVYVIRSAAFAIHGGWRRSAQICIEPEYELEAFSNPSVIKTADGYRMWFCSRSSDDYRDGRGSYRIKCADSTDGITFTRLPNGGLDVAPDGWDSKMTAYPYVVEVDGRLLMFYNGNGFGKTGIGYAEWKA